MINEEKYWVGLGVTRKHDGMKGKVTEFHYSGGMSGYAGIRIRWEDGTEEDTTDSNADKEFQKLT